MVKVGVVGVGHLGQFHVRKFMAIPGCELVGIYDAKPERALEISQKLGVKNFPSYESLLEEVDAIDIAATTTYHYALAKPALEMGKHIFLEKPITSELAQAEELLEIARARDLKIQVGHIERFNPVILEVESEINDPMFIESHRLSTFHHRGTDVPVVLDLMIHDIDLILDFVKSPVKEIRASGIGILTHNIDIANARLEFENGAVANVTSSRVSLKQERKIRFFQRDGYFSMDFVAKQVSVIRKSPNIMQFLPQLLLGNPDIKTEQLVDIKLHDVSESGKDALQLELESFIECIAQDKTPIVDGEAGTRALRIALEIINQINRRIKDQAR
ncbi:MAG TPA: Gfo/Idh/MocA family oxidoreductase [Candidatus Cloacimonadota bacterium]|nr:Gfo/Idh/MocA family oxidoreductase [Candidatus Cloacimonadota bacterium]